MSGGNLHERLSGMISGYCTSQAIYAAASLKIADLLVDGPTARLSIGCYARWRVSTSSLKARTATFHSRHSPSYCKQTMRTHSGPLP